MILVGWLRSLFWSRPASAPEIDLGAEVSEEMVLVPVSVLRLIEFGARTGQFSDEMQDACEKARALLPRHDAVVVPLTRDGWR